MNRSRYMPHAAYSINPYHPQPYGSVPIMPGMMAPQTMALPPTTATTYGNSAAQQSPIQTSLLSPPNAMWTANFANGPIIEDLCVPPQPPPPHHLASSPPLNALPPRMAAPPMMHPGAMPQVQNVFGIRQPAVGPQHHPFAGMPVPHPGHAQHGPPMVHHHHHHPPGMPVPAARVMGSYPPYVVGQPQQPHQQQHQQAGVMYHPSAAAAVLGRPRLETGFPSAPVGGGGGAGGAAAGMQQQYMGSPEVGNHSASGLSPEVDGMAPLTPGVEEALRGFLSQDLGELGDLGRA